MKNHEIPSAEERLPITSPDAMELAIRDIEQQEQLYSIALFDILGFSNLVQNNELKSFWIYINKLLDIIHKMESNYIRKWNSCGQCCSCARFSRLEKQSANCRCKWIYSCMPL